MDAVSAELYGSRDAWNLINNPLTTLKEWGRIEKVRHREDSGSQRKTEGSRREEMPCNHEAFGRFCAGLTVVYESA